MEPPLSRPGVAAWRTPLAAAIAVFLAARLAIFLVYGPVTFPDSADYTQYADTMLRGSGWLRDDGGGAALPLSFIRLPGYPAVVALGRALGDGRGLHLVVLLQVAAGLGATLALYAFARRLLGSDGLAALVAGIAGVSLSALLDVAILADGLFGSIYLALLAGLGLLLLDGEAARRWRIAALCGLGAAALVLLRGNGLFVAATVAPLALAAVQAGAREGPRRAALLALLIVPLVVTVAAVRAWNESRTGTAFVSTGGAHVMFQPLFRMARNGDNPYAGDDTFDRIVRAHAGDYRFQDIGVAIGALHREAGLSPVEIAGAATRKYVETALARPLDLLRAVASGRHLKAVLGLVNPVATGVETWQDIAETPLFPPPGAMLRDPLGALDPTTGALALAYAAFGLVSIAVFVVFLVGAPWLAIRRWRANGLDDPVAAAAAALWLAWCGTYAMYGLLHLELRYLACVGAIPVLLALLVVRERAAAGYP